MTLDDLKPGDQIKGFDWFGCIPPKSTRKVRTCEHGLYVKCAEGRHFLDGQVGDDGHLVGLSRA